MDRCHDLFQSIREVANTYSPDVVPQGIENMTMLTVELRQLLKQQDSDITRTQLRDLLVKVSEQMGAVRSLTPPPPVPPSRGPAPKPPLRLLPPPLPGNGVQGKSLGVPAIGRSSTVTASFMAELNGKLKPGTKDRRVVEDDNDTPPNYPPPPPPVEIDATVSPLKLEETSDSNAGKLLKHLQLDRPQFKGRRQPTRKQAIPEAVKLVPDDLVVVVLPPARQNLSAERSAAVIVEVRQEPEQIALLRQALDAFKSGRKEDGQEIVTRLSERFPDATKPLFTTVYTEAKKEGKKYAAQLGHPKFGRAAFFGKDKCDVSSSIRITAVKTALESELSKLS